MGDELTPRQRLLRAIAEAVADKGYADTTIADVVARAAVSRRTFYEHFANKAECLIALYQAASWGALGVLRDAIDPTRPWQDQLEQAIEAYLRALSAQPALLHTLFIEILAIGPQGLAARRELTRGIAAFVMQVVQGSGVPPAQQLTEPLACGLVGAIHELVLEAVESQRADRLHELTPQASALVRRLTLQVGRDAPADPAASQPLPKQAPKKH